MANNFSCSVCLYFIGLFGFGGKDSDDHDDGDVNDRSTLSAQAAVSDSETEDDDDEPVVEKQSVKMVIIQINGFESRKIKQVRRSNNLIIKCGFLTG